MTPGETRESPSSGGDADAARAVDHRAVFEQLAAPCLLVLPDAPRFSVVAASDAYLALAATSRAASRGAGLLEVLPRGARPSDGEREQLRASLGQASALQTLTRARLGGSPPAAGEGAPARAGWSVVAQPVLGDAGAVRYLLCSFVAARGGPAPLEAAAELELGGELELSGELGVVAALERQLGERIRELAAARAELESFSYSVAHDLRAPLRAIDGFCHALSQDCAGQLDAPASSYLEQICAGAQRMSRLLDGLLELSRILRSPLRKTRVDLSELARGVLGELRRSHPERVVEVELAPRLSVHADAHLTRVLLEKLLGNAWKFSSKNPRATIRVGRDASSGPPALFVADDGVGFDMACAGRLFSPFQRLHRASEFDGTGMGLAIAQRIVSRHGGRIWAQAEVGRGARFCWTLEPGSAPGA